MKTIKEQIDLFVLLTGVSRYRIAKEANVPRSYLSRLKNGHQQNTFSHTADKLREAMRVIDMEVASRVLN